MTPRVVPKASPPQPDSSFRLYRPRVADVESDFQQEAFWRWASAPWMDGGDARESLAEDELRVLSKAASGGGFLVPTDLGDKITAAARAASAVAHVAQEIVTDGGETMGMALASTHGTASWIAESGSYAATDETITQQNLGAHKAGTKIVVSEELRTDEAVELDNYLALELGSRLGVLQENAFCQRDGSGKPLGLVHSSSPYTVVNAATGSSTVYKLADIVSVFKALPAAYRPQASFLVNADDFASLAGTADTAGGLVFPALQFDPPSLFGRPVFIADLPAPAASAKSLVFGNFRLAYGVRRVRPIIFQRQDEIASDNGHVGFRAAARVDGRPLLADAARILAHSAT
jgi:HK97 family phage major capsid protein